MCKQISHGLMCKQISHGLMCKQRTNLEKSIFESAMIPPNNY